MKKQQRCESDIFNTSGRGLPREGDCEKRGVTVHSLQQANSKKGIEREYASESVSVGGCDGVIKVMNAEMDEVGG